jgi:hypothetical protein
MDVDVAAAYRLAGRAGTEQDHGGIARAERIEDHYPDPLDLLDPRRRHAGPFRHLHRPRC